MTFTLWIWRSRSVTTRRPAHAMLRSKCTRIIRWVRRRVTMHRASLTTVRALQNCTWEYWFYHNLKSEEVSQKIPNYFCFLKKRIEVQICEAQSASKWFMRGTWHFISQWKQIKSELLSLIYMYLYLAIKLPSKRFSLLHLRACTLVQKSYCYTPGVGVRVGVGVHMQNVRANVKVLEFKSFCIFF